MWLNWLAVSGAANVVSSPPCSHWDETKHKVWETHGHCFTEHWNDDGQTLFHTVTVNDWPRYWSSCYGSISAIWVEVIAGITDTEAPSVPSETETFCRHVTNKTQHSELWEDVFCVILFDLWPPTHTRSRRGVCCCLLCARFIYLLKSSLYPMSRGQQQLNRRYIL